MHGEAIDPWTSNSRWTLGPGRLQGQTAYDYVARGRGAMDGVQVLWGRSPEAPDHATARRFKVLIGSEVLWRHHLQGEPAIETARVILGAITRDLWTSQPAEAEVKVRRVDVCIDHWGYRWDQDDLRRFACRQKVRAMDRRCLRDGESAPEGVQVYRGAQSETYYVGSRGGSSRFLRVYNKTVEAAASGKLPWMQPAWRAMGWNGRSTVWRAEVEHGGEWLKDHGLDSMTKLDGCEHQLWRDYVTDVRHTTGNNVRLKRAGTSRVWKCLRGAIGRAERSIGAVGSWKWQPRQPSPDGDMATLTAMAAGCIRKLRDGMFRGDDAAPGLWDFMREALTRSDARVQRRQATIALQRPPPRRPKPQPATVRTP